METAQKRPFGIKDKLGYMFGDFANDFFFILVSTFLMVFYTNVLGINGGIVAILFLAARFVDAFTDVGMGRIVDNAKPNPYGRYRVWIKRMKLPVVIAGILMFLPWVSTWSYSLKIVYIFVTYILWGSFAYTSINIPYGSMASAMTDVPVQRSSLSTFRSVGATLAGVLIGSITPLLVYDNVNGAQVLNGNKLFVVALVFAVLAYIFYTLCHKWCIERVEVFEAPAKEKQNILQLFKSLGSNRPLLAIILISMVSLMSMLLMQSMNLYLFQDYFKNIAAMSVAGLVATGGTLIIAPFASKLADRFGKKEVCAAGTLFAALIYGILFVVRIQNPWVFCAMLLVANLGAATFTLLTWAFIGDIIDYQTVKTGDCDGGTIYGLYSFARKIGQALAGGLGGMVLSAIGYVSSTAGSVVEQTTEVTNAIYSVATGAPFIGFAVICLLLVFLYPLGKKQMLEVTAKLREMNAETIEAEAAENK